MWPRWIHRPAPEPLDDGALRPEVRRLLDAIADQAHRTAGSRALNAPLDPGAQSALFRAGLAALTLPTDCGGLGASTREFCLCIRSLAALGPAWPIMAVPHLCIGVKAIDRLAPAAWRERVFSGVTKAHELLVFAISEDQGSDLMAMQTRLSGDGDGQLRLRGAKQWITNLGQARHAVVAARNQGSLPPGYSLILLDLHAEGVHRQPHAWPKRCAAGAPTGALYLDDVRIDRAQVLGHPGEGLALFQRLVQPGRLGAAAALIGMAEASALACGRHAGATALASVWQALDHAAACLDDCDDPAHPDADLQGLCALVKHEAGVRAQASLEALAETCRKDGVGLPPLLLQCQHAAGLFRLLKGPGEVLGLQALAGWMGRTLPPLPHPRWQQRRWHWAAETTRQCLAALAQAGGALLAPDCAPATHDLLATLHRCLVTNSAADWRRAAHQARRLRSVRVAGRPATAMQEAPCP